MKSVIHPMRFVIALVALPITAFSAYAVADTLHPNPNQSLNPVALNVSVTTSNVPPAASPSLLASMSHTNGSASETAINLDTSSSRTSENHRDTIEAFHKLTNPSAAVVAASASSTSTDPTDTTSAANTDSAVDIIDPTEVVSLVKEQASSGLTPRKGKLANYKPFSQTGTASWYGKYFHGRLTANGERYNMHEMTAAHRYLPLNSLVKVTNLANNKALIVRINDRGPYVGNRVIDLSQGAASALGYKDNGTARVKIQAVNAAHLLQ